MQRQAKIVPKVGVCIIQKCALYTFNIGNFIVFIRIESRAVSSNTNARYAHKIMIISDFESRAVTSQLKIVPKVGVCTIRKYALYT